jgi:transposase
MPKKYLVELSKEQETELRRTVKKGKASARQITRAHILLQADSGASDAEIAENLQTSLATVERTRKKFVQHGMTHALKEKPRPGAPRKLDGKQTAFLVALACSDPPSGHVHWTMQLLADRLVRLQVSEAVSDETVRRMLKKTN